MASVTFRGKLMQTVAALPIIGSHAPDFTLTNTELIERSLKDFHGQKVVLNIFISVDTPTCARATVHFNKLANQLKNLIVLSISADLPFAQKRFCAAEGLNKVLALSTFRHPEFGQKYGVTITSEPLKGLLARAVILLDENGKVVYTQQVAEISQEPDYNALLNVLKNEHS